MKVDIGPLLRGECSKIDIDFTLAPEPVQDVEFEADAKVVGQVTDNAGYMRLTLSVELPFNCRQQVPIRMRQKIEDPALCQILCYELD